MDEAGVLQFKAAGLEVHCREIELVERRGAEPRRIVAPGRIYQQPDGSLRFTAYPSRITRVPTPTLPLGVAIPEERYWDFRAEDRYGQRWTCERLYLDVDDVHMPPWRPIGEQLRSLHREESRQTPYRGAHFTGYVFRSLKIDPNARTQRTMTRPTDSSVEGHANIMRLPIGELEVDIRQESEYTVFDVATETHLPERFEQRFLEAVRFVFARPLSWSATVRTAGLQRTTYLRGHPLQDQAAHFGMPVPNNVVDSWQAMCELLRRYYLHIIRDTTRAWHPLSIWWSEVLRAGSREVESLVLIAAVAVEGVVKAMIEAGDAPQNVEYVSKEDAGTWGLRAARALEQIACPEKIRNRVDGLFSQMGGIGTLDVLFALERQGAVDKDLVNLWRSVRPAAAHGSSGRWSSAQRIDRDANGLVTLLRQLTFWWIGYRGYYTDLAEGGWRYREYSPVQLAPAEGAEADSEPQSNP